MTAVQTASQLASVTDVVAVDNASGDDSVELLRAAGGNVHVLVNDANLGFGAAANRAAAAATGDILIFLNSDAELSQSAVATLVEATGQQRGWCIVGPRLVGPAGGVQRSAGLLPRPADLAIRALEFHTFALILGRIPRISGVLQRSRLARDYASAVKADAPIATDVVSGACFAIGREAFKELGGFDERFFMYFEDADLCRRASAAGMPIRYVPDAVVTHIGGASSSEDYHFGPLHARSMRQYLGKWYGPAGSALAIVLLWLRALGLTLALRPAARRAWRALWAAVTDEDQRR